MSEVAERDVELLRKLASAAARSLSRTELAEAVGMLLGAYDVTGAMIRAVDRELRERKAR